MKIKIRWNKWVECYMPIKIKVLQLESSLLYHVSINFVIDKYFNRTIP